MPPTVNMTILYLSPSVSKGYASNEYWNSNEALSITTASCFKFTQKEAVPFGEMSIKRCCTASVVINESLWITGGRGMHFYCFLNDQRISFNPLRSNGMAFLFFNV